MGLKESEYPGSEEQGRSLQRAVPFCPLPHVFSFQTQSHYIALASLELDI